MIEKFFAKLKEKEKIPGPAEIDFEKGVKLKVDFECQEGQEREVRFQLLKDGQVLHDFKKDAPPGTRVILDANKRWGAQNKGKVIMVGEYSGVDGIISFLHEVGHLYDEEGYEKSLSARRHHLDEIIEDKKEEYPDSRLLALKNERKIVIERERKAWAYALLKTRSLEKELGISILKKMGKVEDIVNYINKCLDSYENYYLRELRPVNVFSKREMRAFFEELEGKKKDYSAFVRYWPEEFWKREKK